uniref:Uncharacterized protein n=1 Tax=Anopheles dirus TaxID=7168 RepID=A0A182NX45_9DIPT
MLLDFIVSPPQASHFKPPPDVRPAPRIVPMSVRRSSCGDQFSISSAVSSMVCSQLKISMWRSYFDSGLPRSFSMSWKLVDFFSGSAVVPCSGNVPTSPIGAGELVDFPPTGDADAFDMLVDGTISSVGPGLVAANAAASRRSRLNSLCDSRSSARSVTVKLGAGLTLVSVGTCDDWPPCGDGSWDVEANSPTATQVE